jgi:methionyl-tRNA formyltransferase
LKLVFMGTPPFAAHCLERLLQSPHEIAAVVTRADKPRGRGMEMQPSACKELANTRGIEVVAPATAKDPDLARRLRELAPDLCVVVAYGRLLPATILEVAPLGCINAHASLLPRLRGAAPIERAILEGYERTGVTIMRISERMDAGDMQMSRAIAITPEMDAGELRRRLADVAAELLVEAVEQLARGEAKFEPQDEAQATYAPPLRREEARIEWTRTAADAGRRVRAFAPSPGAFTFAGGRRMKIIRGRPLEARTDAVPGSILDARGEGIAVACGEGVYVVDTLQPEGKRPMSGAAWARGSSQGATPRFGDE